MRSTPHSLRRFNMNCAVVGMCETSLFVARVRYRREQRVLGLPGVETGVLHDDGHLRLDHAGVPGIPGDRLRIAELVEARVKGTSGRNPHPVGSRGFTVLEIDRNLDLRVFGPGI